MSNRDKSVENRDECFGHRMEWGVATACHETVGDRRLVEFHSDVEIWYGGLLHGGEALVLAKVASCL